MVALLVLAGAGGLWYARRPGEAPAAASETMGQEKLELVTASGVRSLLVEVARTPEQQAKGLMFRTELADDRGMLFPHQRPREVSMWMRNTYITLDMVFIRQDGVVHRIEARAEPLSERIIDSRGEVSAVLELAGGAAERLGLKPGDRVEHKEFQTR